MLSFTPSPDRCLKGEETSKGKQNTCLQISAQTNSVCFFNCMPWISSSETLRTIHSQQKSAQSILFCFEPCEPAPCQRVKLPPDPIKTLPRVNSGPAVFPKIKSAFLQKVPSVCHAFAEVPTSHLHRKNNRDQLTVYIGLCSASDCSWWS